jgi:hypothetical protein
MAIQFLEGEALQPSSGDQVFGGEGPCYARFRFLPADREPWVGAFACTGVNYNTFARGFGPTGDVLVVARGQGYVLNVPQRALRFTTADDYLFDARAIPGQDAIVACSCVYLCAYSSQREQWVSDDFAFDGIGLGEVTPAKVSGWQWQHDGWYGFTLFVDGWRLEPGGLLSRDDRGYPDPGLTFPPPVLPEDSGRPSTAA